LWLQARNIFRHRIALLLGRRSSIDFVKGAGVNSELVHFFVVPYLAGTIM
jgi:hypothetical protein